MPLLVEQSQIVQGVVPVDLAAGANDGDWVSLKGYGRCAVIVQKAVGVAAQDPTLTMEQATAVAGTGAKALTFERIDVKQAVDILTIGQFTKVTQAAAATYTEGTSGESQAVWVVEFNAEDLDVEGGFDCLRARIADPGATAQLGSILYVLLDPVYSGAAPISAIVD